MADAAADDFTCALCGETFARGWSEEEAAEESRLLFGDLPPDDLAVVCDDCFARIHPHRN
jgi:hypothetical protein